MMMVKIRNDKIIFCQGRFRMSSTIDIDYSIRKLDVWLLSP
jgi:hypothetical protein